MAKHFLKRPGSCITFPGFYYFAEICKQVDISGRNTGIGSHLLIFIF